MNDLVRSLGLRAGVVYPDEFTLDHLRRLLSHPTWNQVVQLFRYTRSYADGLRTSALLLDYIDRHRSSLAPEEIAAFEPQLYHLGLAMLDNLDRWDEYLQAWIWIRQNAIYTLKYSKQSPPSRFGTYFIKEDSRALHVHFLYGVSHRKELIERKLARSQRSDHIENLLHEQQSELTREEIQERFNWMLRFLQTGRYDYDPPASRQRARRTKRVDAQGDFQVEEEIEETDGTRQTDSHDDKTIGEI